MEEVSLQIRDKTFIVKKELLSEYSDYFRAMFSGNYIESKQQQIIIDMLDPNIMSIILNYMQMGIIILSEYPLLTIGEIALAANFLQITELIKQIEYTLDLQLNESNWLETMVIAQNASYSQLVGFALAYGLYSFKSVKPECIPTIQRLIWYLSHPYLDVENEMDVFKFGLEWAIKNNISSNTLLLILTCLDMQKVKIDDVREIKESLQNYIEDCSDGLPFEIVDCLFELTSKGFEISKSNLSKHKIELCEKFSERVWILTNSILKGTARLLTYTPVVPIWTLKGNQLEFSTQYLYKFDEDKGFEQYLEVAEKNLWGWNITSWGSTRFVIVCGEHGRGTGIFMRDVKVYDVLRKEWTQHGVQLPSRRHGGVAVIDDFLYIIGGVGEFRVVTEKAIEYDLKQRTFRKIANFPHAIQNPAVCAHENKIYGAGEKNIYCYEASHDKDCWKPVVDTEIRMSCLRSHKNYIYCFQSYFRHLYRFRPGVDKKLEHITDFSNLPAAVCSLGECLMAFTRWECVLEVEKYKGETLDEAPRVLSNHSYAMRVNEVAGSCSLILNIPPMYTELSDIQKLYLSKISI